MTTNGPETPTALLLYDGTCGFCARSVQFVLRHEGRRRTLRFASLQSSVGAEVRERHPELEGVDSVIWVDRSDAAGSERVFVRSVAVLRVLRYLGGVWRALGLAGALVPRVLRDALYDLVARHRQALVPAAESCLLPTPEQRTRFLDWGTDAAR